MNGILFVLCKQLHFGECQVLEHARNLSQDYAKNLDMLLILLHFLMHMCAIWAILVS